MPARYLITHSRSPGDIVVLTALIRDLQLSYPGRFEIGVQTSAMDLWRHNPYITKFDTSRPRDFTVVSADYGEYVRRHAYEPIHFLRAFHLNWERQTKIPVRLRHPWPDLHLSDDEQNVSPITGRYWLLVAGGKSDFTIKVWHHRRFQEVVDRLAERGIRFVQIGSSDTGHWHPPIDRTLNLTGQTNLRDMMRLIQHADGVLCGVTCAMHMAAALQRPCVVVAGGREAWWWEAYVRQNRGFDGAQEQLQVPHRFLHTIGLLDCCQHHGCWRNKVVAINKDKSLCKLPVHQGDQWPLARCMDMITPAHVETAIMAYYEDRTLPPIDDPAPLPGITPEQVRTSPNKSENPLLSLLDDTPQAIQAAVAAAPAVTPAAAALLGGLTLRQALEGRGRAATRPATVPHAHSTLLGGRTGLLATRPTTGPATNGKAGLPLANHGRPVLNAPPVSSAILQDPVIGGRLTLCMLLYGGEEYFRMHEEALDRLTATTLAEELEIRIGSNQLNGRSVGLVEKLQAAGRVAVHYRHPENRYKYPVMREMFHDPARPITTTHTIWFDDDTVCDRDPYWLYRFAAMMVRANREGAGMCGPLRYWTITPTQAEWIKQAAWYKGRPFQDRKGRETPNGKFIEFASGSFWAIRTELIRSCDIPDPRIQHNGGDYMIGEQLWQNGYGVQGFCTNKEFVTWSKYKRRGASQQHAGT